MKKTIFALLLTLIGINAISQIIPYNGNSTSSSNSQNVNRNTRQSDNSFSSAEEAKNAYFGDNYSYYIPSDTRNYGVNPVDGVNTIAAPLESDAIMRMPIVGGIWWVIIQQGTVCRFQVVNGRMCQIPYALDACGNAILEMEYVVNVQQAPAPVTYIPPSNKRPCTTCPGEKELYNYNLNSAPLSLNNYSNRQNSIPYQPMVVYENPKKGWSPFTKTLVAAVVIGTASYFIFKANPSDPVDQEIITLPASFRKAPGIGIALSF